MRLNQKRALLGLSFLPSGLVGLLNSYYGIRYFLSHYHSLHTPPFFPPCTSFILVEWLLLLLLSFATMQMLLSPAFEDEKRNSYAVFIGQLLMNGVWYFTFFHLRIYGLSILILLLLAALICINALLYYRIQHLLGYLLLPSAVITFYLFIQNIWVAFIN